MVTFAIYSYGVGNIFSVKSALEREGVAVEVTKNPKAFSAADCVLLPGVGAFSEAAKMLDRGLIADLVSSGKLLLGICLGLQLLADSSEEGSGKGLGLLSGRSMRLPAKVKVPQVGWNTVNIRKQDEVLDGVRDSSWVYFVHSYYPAIDGPSVLATTEYGVTFPCIVRMRNVLGTQFHPEKSGPTGRILLKNIVRLARR